SKLVGVWRSHRSSFGENSEQVGDCRVAGEQTAVLELVVLQPSLGLPFIRFSLGPRFVVDAKGPPKTEDVVREKSGHESVPVVLEIAPIRGNDGVQRFIVDVFTEERAALEK